jgi:hypothetical protein
MDERKGLEAGLIAITAYSTISFGEAREQQMSGPWKSEKERLQTK